MADELLNIVNKVNAAIRSDKIRRIALMSTLAKHKPRIFTDGLSDDGSKIGNYSPATAKLKSEKGRNPGFVNFTDTGQMVSDYGLVIEGETYAFGFQNEFNAQKAEWLSDKYKKTPFHASDEEVEVLLNVLIDELNKAI